mmetsp:Transcript_7340/g.9593  ORF Transcript_7340/g.9593 Transcript_7340/m.9593 type:complete len:80 (-) Transcript_7340:723-962(-)
MRDFLFHCIAVLKDHKAEESVIFRLQSKACGGSSTLCLHFSQPRPLFHAEGYEFQLPICRNKLDFQYKQTFQSVIPYSE